MPYESCNSPTPYTAVATISSALKLASLCDSILRSCIMAKPSASCENTAPLQLSVSVVQSTFDDSNILTPAISPIKPVLIASFCKSPAFGFTNVFVKDFFTL